MMKCAGDPVIGNPVCERGQPEIIQGGMGVAVSGWRLARAVSCRGQLGVVSGTALDVVLVRRLQSGDPGGDVRRALGQFPDRAVADEVVESYFVPGGKPEDGAFASVAMYSAAPTRRRHALAVLGGFVEVFLAREGHDGRIGINFLEKIQLPTPATHLRRAGRYSASDVVAYLTEGPCTAPVQAAP